MRERLTLRRRSSGILLHPTSLPGPHGIGDLGAAAYRFADFLASSGQSWWQMLPIGPPGANNSPYEASSAFAGSPLLLSLEKLAEKGLLGKKDLRPTKDLSPVRVNYGAVTRFKQPRLIKAYQAFRRRNDPEEQGEFESFCGENEVWLSDYALFSALKSHRRGASWLSWEAELRRRKPAAIACARDKLRKQIRFYQFLQYLFSSQWSELRQYCLERGVGLIGDLPIYVSQESADVWANQELFWLDSRGKPTFVAGVPPDYFSKTGQLWGNPLYRWDVLRERGYDWWIARFRANFDRFDAIRLDHFIGFERYWEIPARQKTATKGRWVAGPKDAFFEKLLESVGPVELIAEDLGVVTPEVKALRDRFGFPGIRVLQFAFGNDPEAESYQPHNYPRHCVAYTGTHDNDTIIGWFTDKGSKSSTRSKEEIQKEHAFALRYSGSDGREVNWDMIRLALSSAANVVIIPMQDVIGLGAEARMNHPGRKRGNWVWRLVEGALKREHGERLLGIVKNYGR